MTPDDGGHVSNMLSTKVCARIAARLAGYLKQDFVNRERETIGTLREILPKNGEIIREANLLLRGDIVAEHPITDFALYVRNRRQPHYEVASSKKTRDMLDPNEQAQGSIYRIHLEPPLIPLEIGLNLIHIEFAVSGRYTSRTLYYKREK